MGIHQDVAPQNRTSAVVGPQGLDSVEAGVRLRYEFAREFAPYIGIAHERKFSGSADFAGLAGEDRSATNFVLGVRFWF